MRSIHFSGLKRGILILIVLCVSLLYAKEALSQAATTGVLLGTVKDATAAVVPGAQVTVTNSATGLVRNAETSVTGDFRFPLLPAGLYTFRIGMEGFETLVSDDVAVHVGVETRVDFALNVGAVGTTVEVLAAVAIINTTNSERGDLIGSKRVVELPLNFREFTQLALLVPGSVLDTKQRIFALKTNISVNGLRAQNANIMIDGIDSNESHWGGSSMSFYNLDSVAEFKLTSSNYSAELRGSSFNIRAVTKSGANKVHGTAYEFVRNNIFDARDFFERNEKDNNGNEIPESAIKPFRRNQFGATAGGPIIPNKLFWFTSYEGLREVVTRTGFGKVPTVAERTGTVQAVNPVTGLDDTLFVTVAPSTAGVIGRYPLPNDPGGAFGPRTFTGPIRTTTKFDQYTVKLDWQKSEKDTFSAGWTYFNEWGPNSDDLTQGPDFGVQWIVRARHAFLTNTHIFSPNLVNEIRVGYHRDVGLPGTQSFVSPSGFTDGALSTLNNGSFSFGTITNNIQFIDNVSYIRGRHSLKAGFEFRNVRDTTSLALLFPGNFLFSPTAAIVADIPTASGVTIPAGSAVNTSVVNFLQGAPDFVRIAGASDGFPGPPGYYNVRQSAFNWFIQDDIKITPKLTLNLGLRYEYNTILRFRHRGNVKQILVGPNVGDTIFNPDPYYNPDRNNFAPRIGFAYAASPKMVIRAGFAVFTVGAIRQATEGATGFFPMQNRFEEFLPFAERVSAYTPTLAVTLQGPPMFDVNGGQITPDGPGSEKNRLIDGVRFFNENGFLMATDTNGGRYPDNYRDAYVMNWNLTLEREMGQGVALSGAYVGNSGVALHSISLPFCGVLATNPDCTQLQQLWFDKGTNVPWVQDNSAHSTYHAFQFQAKKANFEKGYSFQGSYTFAKNLSNNDSTVSNSPSGSSNLGGTNPLNRRIDKGRTIYDVRQQFLFNAMYEPPFARLLPGPKRLTNGWQFQTIWTLRTGQPYYLSASGLNSGFGLVRSDRPDILMDRDLIPRGTDKTEYFAPEVRADFGKTCGDPTARFFCNPIGRTGTAGRGIFDDASFKDIAFSVIKNTTIKENINLQFRAELFNLFNFVNLDLPDGNILSSGFGQYTTTVSRANPPVTARQIQFGLKLIF
jgi:hypothetical protein